MWESIFSSTPREKANKQISPHVELFDVGCLEAQVAFPLLPLFFFFLFYHFYNLCTLSPSLSTSPRLFMQHSARQCFCLRWVWLCCYHPDSFVRLCVSSAVGRMWHTGRGGLALSDPGKLCHPVIIPSLPVCSQPAHRGGDHHHGYRLSRVCRSCQRESSSAADGKWFFQEVFWCYHWL